MPLKNMTYCIIFHNNHELYSIGIEDKVSLLAQSSQTAWKYIISCVLCQKMDTKYGYFDATFEMTEMSLED